jgi:hypothetical protein
LDVEKRPKLFSELRDLACLAPAGLSRSRGPRIASLPDYCFSECLRLERRPVAAGADLIFFVVTLDDVGHSDSAD